MRVVAQEIGVFLDVDRCLLVYHEGKDINKLRLVAQYCRSDTIPPVREEHIPWAALIQMDDRQVDEGAGQTHETDASC